METPNILNEEQIQAALAELPGWKYENDKISKEFTFEHFKDAFGFIGGLVDFFEENDHHPDIHIMYSQVIFDLSRFDVGGKVTDRDIMVAKEIEKRYSER